MRTSKQAKELRELRAWLGLPPEDDAPNYEAYGAYEADAPNIKTGREEFHGRNIELFEADSKNSNNDSDKCSRNNKDNKDSKNGRKVVCADELDDLFESSSITAIARMFKIGACYQVVSNKTLIKRLKSGEKYAVQTVSESNDDPEFGFTFRYLGKQGIHHTFREISCGWGRTYTDAQLVGKEVIEVKEAEVRALRKSLMQAEVRF